jgi:monoamine oxidase
LKCVKPDLIAPCSRRQRPGGRNWTIRRDAKVEFTDGTVQQCLFDEGQYFNAGPARIPSLHQTILGYCKELGVAMEVEVNTSRSTLLQSDKAFDGRPIEQREVINDGRGTWPSYWPRRFARGALIRTSPAKTASDACIFAEICAPTMYTPAPAGLD